MDARTAQALIRFGLGRRGGQALPTDPMAWLADQIAAPDTVTFPSLPSAAECLAAWRADTTSPPPPGQPLRVRQILAQETIAQTNVWLMTDAGFREHLVIFWANHFTVSLARLECVPVAGAYIREAIRPHVTGRFGDMLLAVMRHPAMLMYLDNITSFGPHSPTGQRLNTGLNENLARECMELHTLSPASGYTQQDVTEFAKVITGWTVDFTSPTPGFVFDAASHEPGSKTVMGRVYPPGEAGGIQALHDLALHPATARHLSTKLARHFVADDPPPALVDRLVAVYLRSGGDLADVYRELVRSDAAWSAAPAKLKTPEEFVVSTARVLAIGDRLFDRPGGGNAGVGIAAIGQRIQGAPSPAGWSDRAEDWLGPDAVWKRVEWTTRLCERAGRNVDARRVATQSLGPLLDAETARQIERAADGPQALALLLLAPEFQRR